MSLIAQNLWEKDQMRKLTTVAAVDVQIERCEQGEFASPTKSVEMTWRKKLVFLARLKEMVATDGLPPVDIVTTEAK